MLLFAHPGLDRDPGDEGHAPVAVDANAAVRQCYVSTWPRQMRARSS